MTRTASTPATRALITGALALLITLGAGLHGMSPAQAGSNSKIGNCITSYNYADPGDDYLFAATEGNLQAYPEPCAWVHVWILQGGCYGTEVAYEQSGFYVTASVTHDSGWWVAPCSRHMGEWHIETHLLPFNY